MRLLKIAMLAACLSLGTVPPGTAQEPGREFSFAKLNRTYTDLVSELAPIEQGPVTVRLSSPEHSLIVQSNRLRLRPAEGGAHAGRLEVAILGKGWLVADVEGAGLATRLQDELMILPQTLAVEAKVKLRRGDGGYSVTTVELPRRVDVRIQSKLANQLVSWCEGLALLLPMDCAGMERSLSVASIPMPEPGGDYLLADAELTPEDRAALDAYLGGSTAASPGPP